MLQWNVAGIDNTDKEFWEYVGKFDYISLCETWTTEEKWDRIKGKLSKEHL